MLLFLFLFYPYTSNDINDKLAVSTSDAMSAAVYMLPVSLLTAVAEIIKQRTGKSIRISDTNTVLRQQPCAASEIALAVAYANLVLDDPETVTQHHLKMLRSHFSIEQIHELTRFIKEKTSE
ncbi:hypothetical protein D770_21505 [Flammeovirgaceae bacterium 311]|nr:hypothetical protein D770_21505 [Flammeovirgaceae bacterium 311]